MADRKMVVCYKCGGSGRVKRRNGTEKQCKVCAGSGKLPAPEGPWLKTKKS